MKSAITTTMGMVALIMVFLVFMNFFQVLTIDQSLKQVDEFLTRKVSIHRALTPEVENELRVLLATLKLDPNSLNFNGSTTEPVEWGESVRIYYEYNKTITQKGMEYLGLKPLELRPRDYLVPALGR